MLHPDEVNQTVSQVTRAKNQMAQYHGAKCWVAGWGHTFYAGQNSNVARSVGLNLLKNEYCKTHRKCSIFISVDLKTGQGRKVFKIRLSDVSFFPIILSSHMLVIIVDIEQK